MNRELRILSTKEFGLLLYRISQLPYDEAHTLERELKEIYHECLEKWNELQTLTKRIEKRLLTQKNDEAETRNIKALIEALIEHSPVEFEHEILAGEPQ
jgi:hypothetical protein